MKTFKAILLMCILALTGVFSTSCTFGKEYIDIEKRTVEKYLSPLSVSNAVKVGSDVVTSVELTLLNDGDPIIEIVNNVKVKVFAKFTLSYLCDTGGDYPRLKTKEWEYISLDFLFNDVEELTKEVSKTFNVEGLVKVNKMTVDLMYIGEASGRIKVGMPADSSAVAS